MSETQELKAESEKAIGCLYVAVDESVANEIQDKVFACIDALERDLAAAQKECEELREVNLKLLRSEFPQMCSSCGWIAPQGNRAWSELQAHVRVCPKHVMREVEQERDQLRAEVAELKAERDELRAEIERTHEPND